MGNEDFVQVVAPMAMADADCNFQKWLEDRRISRSALNDNDVRVDVIRSLDGRSLRRYKVRESIVETLTVAAASDQTETVSAASAASV